MSATTPTMLRSVKPNVKVCPIPSSSGKYRLTNDSLTTATICVVIVSSSLTSRPRRSGIFRLEKKPGVTKRMLAVAWSRRSAGRPGSPTPQIPPGTTIGRKLMYAAPDTPGIARTSSSTRV